MQKGKGKGKDKFLVHMSPCVCLNEESPRRWEGSCRTGQFADAPWHISPISQGSCDPASEGHRSHLCTSQCSSNACEQKREGIYYPQAVAVAGRALSGISSEHGWAFATQVAGGCLLNDTNTTPKQSRLMSVIPSDNLNAHILGKEQPPTHPFLCYARTSSPNIEDNAATALWRRKRE